MTRTSTLELTGGARAVVPDSINLLTPYVLYEQQDWFECEIRFLRRLLEPGQQAIDVGANYGVYSLSIAKAVGPMGRVWAFEPASSTATFLEQGIAANNFAQIVLERCALSRESGTARLTLNENSELNALDVTGRAGSASETVRVVTLDDCLRRYGWSHIDLLKIDAEGQESNIIEGGRRFLTDLSPLILYEVKNQEELNLELVGKFAALGFDSYRLVPGLDLLVPFGPNAKPDGYLLNLFCCKADRAAAISDRGLLLDSASIARANAENRFHGFFHDQQHRYGWEKVLTKLPYAAACAHLWQSKPVDGAVTHALACFAMSEDRELAPMVRYSALQTSVQMLSALCDPPPRSLRLASAARAASDYGARSVAVAALAQLYDELSRNPSANLSEPFLPPGRRFDTIAPRENIQHWLLAAVLEEFERLGSFSSFYTGETARTRLEIIASLGYESEEMRRRLLLLRTRFPKSE
jgi:FkbM family methyltransferase